MKLKGSTLLESMVALVIIGIALLAATSAFGYVLRSGNSVLRWEAHSRIQWLKNNENLETGIVLETDGMVIRRLVTNSHLSSNCYQVEWKATDTEGRMILSELEIIPRP